MVRLIASAWSRATFVALSLGDVGVDDDHSATGQRIVLDLEHTFGPGPFERVVRPASAVSFRSWVSASTSPILALLGEKAHESQSRRQPATPEDPAIGRFAGSRRSVELVVKHDDAMVHVVERHSESVATLLQARPFVLRRSLPGGSPSARSVSKSSRSKVFLRKTSTTRAIAAISSVPVISIGVCCRPAAIAMPPLSCMRR